MPIPNLNNGLGESKRRRTFNDSVRQVAERRGFWAYADKGVAPQAVRTVKDWSELTYEPARAREALGLPAIAY